MAPRAKFDEELLDDVDEELTLAESHEQFVDDEVAHVARCAEVE